MRMVQRYVFWSCYWPAVSGNELCGSGVSARLDAKQYAKDLVKLRQTVKDVYQKARPMPKIMGPAGFYDKEWFDTFLEAAGPHAVDGLSHHTYNLGPGLHSFLSYYPYEACLETVVENSILLSNYAFLIYQYKILIFENLLENWINFFLNKKNWMF